VNYRFDRLSLFLVIGLSALGWAVVIVVTYAAWRWVDHVGWPLVLGWVG
jgi:hypothetical protein